MDRVERHGYVLRVHSEEAALHGHSCAVLPACRIILCLSGEDLFQFFSHAEVVLQMRERLRCPLLEIFVIAALGISAK
jgi:hypothetical protein